MKEWHRTVALVLLLALAVGYLVWSYYTVDASFTNLIR